MAYSLTELTKQHKDKNNKCIWTSEHVEAFKNLKTSLTTAPFVYGLMRVKKSFLGSYYKFKNMDP